MYSSIKGVYGCTKLEESDMLPRSHQLSNSIPLTSNICVACTDAKLVLMVWTVPFLLFGILQKYTRYCPDSATNFWSCFRGPFTFGILSLCPWLKLVLGVPFSLTFDHALFFVQQQNAWLPSHFFAPACQVEWQQSIRTVIGWNSARALHPLFM